MKKIDWLWMVIVVLSAMDITLICLYMQIASGRNSWGDFSKIAIPLMYIGAYLLCIFMARPWNKFFWLTKPLGDEKNEEIKKYKERTRDRAIYMCLFGFLGVLGLYGETFSLQIDHTAVLISNTVRYFIVGGFFVLFWLWGLIHVDDIH